MAIDGDITVWVSNGYAFARFEAESKTGRSSSRRRRRSKRCASA